MSDNLTIMAQQSHTTIIPEQYGGLRLDQALSQLFDQFSRSQLQAWIKAGQVKVNGRTQRARDRVYGGETVVLEYEETPQTVWQAEAIPLHIVFEDDSLLVIDKPAGMVVHPAAGHESGTLCNALLYHHPGAEQLPRAGIIHRLDKDTSGLLVVAKTAECYQQLVRMMQARQIRRHYLALVYGQVTSGGTIDQPVGRHPVDRKRMAVTPAGKPAVTHYRIRQRFKHHTLLSVELETGRTHQIRVHLAYTHYPLVGDPVYGGRLRIPKHSLPGLRTFLQGFKRQALHACQLALPHPVSQQPLRFDSSLPADMARLLELLTVNEAGDA